MNPVRPDEPAPDGSAEPSPAGTDDLHEVADLAVLDPSPPTIRERAGGTAAGIVVAAMLGVGEVLEPEKTSPDIEIIGEAPQDEPIVDLDLVFDGLPPLG